jgi:hypothetical protein
MQLLTEGVVTPVIPVDTLSSTHQLVLRVASLLKRSLHLNSGNTPSLGHQLVLRAACN